MAIDAFRACFDAVQRAVYGLGVRRTTVAVTIETYSAPVNTAGAILVTSTTVTVSPNPKVRLLQDGPPSWFGGGLMADSSGVQDARVYEIGPIAQTYRSASSGGYGPTYLLPAISSPANRVFVTLTDVDGSEEFQSGGERFRIVHYDASRPMALRLFVQRAPQT